MKRYFILWLLAIGSFLTCNADVVPSMITITADGSETEYELSSVQKITVKTNASDAEMVLAKKDNTTADGIRCVKFGTMTANVLMSENDDNGVAIFVYPNPVSNYLQINGMTGESVTVMDINGKVIIASNESKIDVSNIQPGVYFVRINNKTVKFVKK